MKHVVLPELDFEVAACGAGAPVLPAAIIAVYLILA
jgi:hypothetical protein